MGGTTEQVTSPYHGPQGLDKARKYHPDVVLCDIGLPGMDDGYEVARATRADETLRVHGPTRPKAASARPPWFGPRRAPERSILSYVSAGAQEQRRLRSGSRPVPAVSNP
jgi:CheY-like chemotaxis protein